VKVDFNYFSRFTPARNTRSHEYKIFVEQCDRNVRYYSFSRCVVNPWNNLPFETVDFPPWESLSAAYKQLISLKYLTYHVSAPWSLSVHA